MPQGKSRKVVLQKTTRLQVQGTRTELKEMKVSKEGRDARDSCPLRAALRSFPSQLVGGGSTQ
jgi:hypothetical protein